MTDDDLDIPVNMLVTVHAGVDKLDAESYTRAVALHVGGRASSPARLSLFLEGPDGRHNKAGVLACLNRWAELVRNLPDDQEAQP